jgi:DNA-binding response OmpR family regulator
VPTVLYVDDEAPIRRALTAWLSRHGYSVFAAGSRAEAIGVLDAHDVDALFIDIWLGTESGFDLFEWVDMHRPRLAEHTAFVTGAIVVEPEVERVLNAFARPVLIKPFELTELEQMITAWSTPGRHSS